MTGHAARRRRVHVRAAPDGQARDALHQRDRRCRRGAPRRSSFYAADPATIHDEAEHPVHRLARHRHRRRRRRPPHAAPVLHGAELPRPRPSQDLRDHRPHAPLGTDVQAQRRAEQDRPDDDGLHTRCRSRGASRRPRRPRRRVLDPAAAAASTSRARGRTRRTRDRRASASRRTTRCASSGRTTTRRRAARCASTPSSTAARTASTCAAPATRAVQPQFSSV